MEIWILMKNCYDTRGHKRGTILYPWIDNVAYTDESIANTKFVDAIEENTHELEKRHGHTATTRVYSYPNFKVAITANKDGKLYTVMYHDSIPDIDEDFIYTLGVTSWTKNKDAQSIIRSNQELFAVFMNDIHTSIDSLMEDLKDIFIHDNFRETEYYNVYLPNIVPIPINRDTLEDM